MSHLEPQSLSYAVEKENLYRREQNTRHHHHALLHQRKLKPRQAGTTVDQVQAVTTVIQTLSYVQQFDVDTLGNVFSTQQILTNTPEGFSLPSTTPAGLTTSDGTSASSSAPSSAASSAQPDSSTQSLPSIASTSQSLTSTPSIPVTSSFPSLSVTFNSTSSATTPLILSSSSSTSSFQNSTTSSTSSRSSLTYLTSSSSSSSGSATSSFDPSSTSSSASSSSPSSSTTPLSSTTSSIPGVTGVDGGGLGGGATGVAPSGASPSSTEAAGAGSGSGSSPPSTSVIAGSVVGGLAGVAFLLILALILLRWKKRKDMLSLGNGNDGGAEATNRDLPPAAPAGGMTQRRSVPFAVPAALASLAAFNKRSSHRSEQSVSTAPSERGFYRVSGRKLPSVLQSGGDGYGGEVPDANTLSGSSFYRDSTGFYSGGGPSHAPGSPLASNPAGPSVDRDSGVPVMRPSPARTPVTEQGPFRPLTPPPPLQPPRLHDRPDGVGRSHPSQDGSHASRFTEEV